MQSKSQPVLNMGPESDYTSEKKRFMQALTGIMHGQTIMVVSKSEEWSVHYSAAASIKFLAFVTTVLLGLVVVIVVMHILGSNCLYPIRVRQPS